MKKKKIQRKPEVNNNNDDNGYDNHNEVNDTTSNSWGNDDNNESADNTWEKAKPWVNELDSTLDRTYWSNGTVGTKTDLYMLSAITTYKNIDGLHGFLSAPQCGYDATVSELSDNLIGMDAVDMLDKSRIMSDMYMNTFSYLMFLKRKRTDVVKVRGCADGRPQSEFISKDNPSSPTVSTYALVISCAMDAMEGRQVVTCNILRAFLQADRPEDNDCYLKFEVLMVDIICDIDPSYKKCILINKKTGKKKLYGKLTKAVYGTLLGAILFYQKLSGQFYDWGYKQNSYDPCTFNKTVNGEQLTIQFHVDDLKCSIWTKMSSIVFW